MYFNFNYNSYSIFFVANSFWQNNCWVEFESCVPCLQEDLQQAIWGGSKTALPYSWLRAHQCYETCWSVPTAALSSSWTARLAPRPSLYTRCRSLSTPTCCRAESPWRPASASSSFMYVRTCALTNEMLKKGFVAGVAYPPKSVVCHIKAGLLVVFQPTRYPVAWNQKYWIDLVDHFQLCCTKIVIKFPGIQYLLRAF